MEALRSTVLNNHDPVEEKPSLGGMYGSDGFFFQQRRGHLNLRSLAAVNIEKLVREVDVDTLQAHVENITFCNLREEDLRYLTDPQIVKLFRVSQLMLEYLLFSQDKLVDNLNLLSKKYNNKKRGLTKKRRELVELEESTKLLRNQVKAKKQNISTLEDLLKEANRTREKELRKLRLHKGAPPESAPSIIKFFITGPEGLCVEFVEKPETDIAQLLQEARKAFISKRDSSSSVYEGDGAPELRLVFKGKILLPGQTIDECRIGDSDALTALLIEAPKKETPAAPSAPATATVDHEALTKQMIEMMSKQQQESMRELASDINSGWKTALETISANARSAEPAPQPQAVAPAASQLDPQVIADMNNNWSRAELGIREQLDALANKHAQTATEVNSLSVLATRRMFQLGELESDNDDAGATRGGGGSDVDLGPLAGRIDVLQVQTTNTSVDVTSLKEMIQAQNVEIQSLKDLLQHQPAPQQPQQTEPKKAPKEFTVVNAVAEPPKENKWDRLSKFTAAAGTVDEEKPVAKVVAKEVTFVEIEAPPVAEKPVEPKPKAVVKPAPAPAIAPKPVVEEKKPDPPSPENVTIVFPRSFNPELSVLLFTNQDFQVPVAADLALDDILFEIRKLASTKTRTQFTKVMLEHLGKKVLLGVDMGAEAEYMTAAVVAEAARTGDLRVKIMPGNPLTNAQIDMLVPSYERQKVFATKKTQEKAAEKQIGSSKRVLKNRRNWDDGDDDDEEDDDDDGGEDDDADALVPLEPGDLPKKVYTKMRSSLDDALQEFSDRDGMTDDELQEHMSRLKRLADANLPQEVSDHLKSFRGSMAGALAAAAVDSGSDTTGPKDGGDVSTGVASVRNSMSDSIRSGGGGERGGSRTVSPLTRSVTLLPRKDSESGEVVATGGLLRLSGSLAGSPTRPGSVGSRGGSDHNDDMSVVSMAARSNSSSGTGGPHSLRRSLEQFDQEIDLSGKGEDDTPMLASISSSADFRRQAVDLSHAEPAAAISRPRDNDQTAGYGIAQTSATAESLLYSPSVSTHSAAGSGAPARSRYGSSADGGEGEEDSDLDDSFGRRKQPAAAAAESLAQDKSWTQQREDDVRELAAESRDATVDAKGEPLESVAEGKEMNRSESVDSVKRDYLTAAAASSAGRGGGGGERDSKGVGSSSMDDNINRRSGGTADRTLLSSIQTVEDSVDSFNSGAQDSYFPATAASTGGSSSSSAAAKSTGEDEMLSRTVDSEGEMLAHRSGGRGGSGSGGVRASEVGRRADSYERNAKSTAMVEEFGAGGGGGMHDDDGSINSLALSDSNNLDDL
eukprot:CAMPEP_0174989194 /NCGR_PEP_ID=MMETSP0004_2-20121128/20579_1 /TAXON_ID=420556 /ORGANISM="Ochromonas sp., Strain CCMP1393" /LENGTH=1304 /DNA_ID=CAMNT_0016242561 /DNA_START=94 /DNA_END=4008 /DNA_ORIENTATION=-